MPIPTSWKPLAVSELQSHLGQFRDWILCGGFSVDLLLGKSTRTHADIDIGVFRSQLIECLNSIGIDRVFLCYPPGSGNHIPWDGSHINADVHDIWISDLKREHWLVQIMVFDDEGDNVFYRRDQRINWPKHSHLIFVDTVRILNPLITFLYKTNKSFIAEKEVMDINALISAVPNNSFHPTPASGRG